jgi:hypothetical protein
MSVSFFLGVVGGCGIGMGFMLEKELVNGFWISFLQMNLISSNESHFFQ